MGFIHLAWCASDLILGSKVSDPSIIAAKGRKGGLWGCSPPDFKGVHSTGVLPLFFSKTAPPDLANFLRH